MNQSKIFDRLSVVDVKSAALGMVLGDAYIQPRASNARLSIAHSPKVLDYVELKKTVLEQVEGIKVKYKHVIHKNRKLDREYPQLRVWSNTHSFFTKIRERVYKPKKQINKRLLNSINEYGLAFWFMDDGHLSLRHNVVRSEADVGTRPKDRSISSRTIIFNTQGFSVEENEIISEWLKDRWGLDSVVKFSRNLPFIFLNTGNSRKLVDIIRPYVLCVPSMYKKIDFKYKTNDPEFLRFNIGYWIKEEGQERPIPYLG